jgi:hypothetical protein
MKFATAGLLMAIASFLLVGALVAAGVSVGQAIGAITAPLILAAAAGAITWSWAEPRARGGR